MLCHMYNYVYVMSYVYVFIIITKVVFKFDFLKIYFNAERKMIRTF